MNVLESSKLEDKSDEAQNATAVSSSNAVATTDTIEAKEADDIESKTESVTANHISAEVTASDPGTCSCLKLNLCSCDPAIN